MRTPVVTRKQRRPRPEKRAGILLVDDTEEDRYFLLRALKTLDLNCAIHVVSSGEEATAYLSSKSRFVDRTRFPVPHLVLLDLKMTEIDGLQVLRWLRNQPALDGLNVVVLADSDLDPDIIKAKELGAKDFILKASNTVDLVHSVREITFQWLG